MVSGSITEFWAGLPSACLVGRQAGYNVQCPTIISYFESPRKGVYVWERSLLATSFFLLFFLGFFLDFYFLLLGCAIVF